MSTLAEILEEMAEQLRGVVATGANDDVQVEPRMIRFPTTPSIDIYPADPSSESQAAGFDDSSGDVLVTVRARVSTADGDAGQDLLLAFLDDEDPLSIEACFHDDPFLGGHASAIGLTFKSGYQLFGEPDDAGAYLGAQWQFAITKARS